LKDVILDIKNLKTHFFLDEGILKAVDGVDLSIKKGQILGLIGESGCGKSLTAKSILRIIPSSSKIVDGEIVLNTDKEQIDLVKLNSYSNMMRTIRGDLISMIFQEPMTSFSPIYTIGEQIAEMIIIHQKVNFNEAKSKSIEMLEKVGVSNPIQRFDEYPHQLSGGLRQRAMIAMALSCNPLLLIADEPTTALDVTIQAQILDLLKELQSKMDMSILYITHDLGVIAEIADDVAVMYLGKIVEYTSVKELFKNPLHPYTIKLLNSIPILGKKRDQLDVIEGTVPTPLNMPPKCGFESRCSEAIKGLCDSKKPHYIEKEKGHYVRCFLYESQEGN